MVRDRRPRRASGAVAPPKKPYPTFPLTPHASGKWQKKIDGKIHYFGAWRRVAGGRPVRVEGDGWKEALEEYERFTRGLSRRPESEGLTVADLCNRYLTAKLRKVESGELSPQTFAEYRQTTDLIVAAFGRPRLVADDFERLRAAMARKWGPVRLANAVTRVKGVFKYGFDNGLIDRPVRFGGEFKKPDRAVLRRHRAKAGEKMIEAADLRKLLAAASVPMRAMILLGVNAGFGNHDVATLPLTAVDLSRGWLSFPRPKTGIPRRCPLWPETVDALRAAIAGRPEPRRDDARGLVFVTSRGSPWVRTTGRSRTDIVSVQFAELLKAAGLHRPGLGFYTLRHVFRTVADAARDPVAIDLIMGHADPSMGSHYRERVDDDRLKAVTDHVRAWLFPTAERVSDGS